MILSFELFDFYKKFNRSEDICFKLENSNTNENYNLEFGEKKS